MKLAVCSLICFHSTWSCCWPDAKPWKNEEMMELGDYTLTVVSCYEASNQFFHILKRIIQPSRWKHLISLLIVVKVPECMTWVFLSNNVGLLSGFNLVTIPHVFDPGCLKLCYCIRKFVPEGLHFTLPQWIIKIVPARLLILQKFNGLMTHIWNNFVPAWFSWNSNTTDHIPKLLNCISEVSWS